MYTAHITTEPLASGDSCLVVASNSPPPHVGVASYSTDGSNVTATYTNGCPSILPCCDSNNSDHYKEDYSYDGGTEDQFNNIDSVDCGKTISKIRNYVRDYSACKDGALKDPIIVESKTNEACFLKFQQFLIQRSYGNKYTNTIAEVNNQTIRNLTNISTNQKYIYWKSDKVFTLWVGSYEGSSFKYRNVRVDFKVGSNWYHIILEDTRNIWNSHRDSDGTFNYPTKNNYGRCLARFRTSNQSNKRIERIKITADIKEAYGLSNPGNGFWICTPEASNGSECSTPIIEPTNDRSSYPP